MLYTAKIPFILKWIYPSLVWDIPSGNNQVYLSFDDGPHPEITPFVLAELQKVNAKATFFCIGDNVEKYPAVYDQILREGHRTGNHTFNHLNGWNTSDETYIENIEKARQWIHSDLFRPPYGKIKRAQIKLIRNKWQRSRIIMWDVLSADFDINLTAEQCINNVLSNVKQGSIIVFHDSEKAFPRLRQALPVVLENLRNRGFNFETIK